MVSIIIFEQQSKYNPKYKVRVVQVILNSTMYFSQILENDETVFERRYSSKYYAKKKALEFDDESWYKDIEILKKLKTNKTLLY